MQRALRPHTRVLGPRRRVTRTQRAARRRAWARARAVVLVAWLSLGCGHEYRRPSEPAGRWLHDLGERSATWEPCLRIAIALRAACEGAAPCERAVSEDLSYACYAGRYRASTQGHDPMKLSPCFWEARNHHGGMLAPGEPGYRDEEQFAIETCGRLRLPPPAQPHCLAELRFVTTDLCTRGDSTLTGAGP